MANIENIERTELVKLMGKFIKKVSESMGTKTNVEVPIDYSNWVNGAKRWSFSRIEFDGNTYTFNDREIAIRNFVFYLNNALKASGVDGKVFCDTDMYDTPIIFRRLEIFGKPCKEFNALNKMLVKNGAREIGKLDVNSVRICGKRSCYDECGNYRYLCFSPKDCTTITEAIKKDRKRGWKLSVSIKPYVNHGDEYDYEIAMYQESEWYGTMGNEIEVTFRNGKGEKVLKKSYRM
jgi:hypothetical protein